MLDVKNTAPFTQARNVLGQRAAIIVSDGQITAQERAGFINNVYQMILGRKPSTNEFTYWSRLLPLSGNLNQLIENAIEYKLKGGK